MTINTYTLGPGKLVLGSGPFNVQGQTRNCRVEWSENVTTRDAIPVLSGEEIAAGEAVTHSAVLAGTMLQDLIADGVVDWSWSQRGVEQDFVFVPNNTVDRAVKGVLKPVPLTLGGDVLGQQAAAGDPPTADFTWRCIGFPIFGVYDPVTGTVTEDA